MADWRLRVRAVLETQFTVVVVGLLLLALLGGWMTYTAYAASEPVTEEQSTTMWEQTGAFEHSATVQEENPVFPVGTTLESRQVYFSRLSPELSGTFRTSYDVRDSGELTQTVSLVLIIRSVEDGQQENEQTVHWETTDTLANSTIDSVEPGESVSVQFAQNMSAVDTRVRRIRDEIGASPGKTEVLVRATVISQGTVNGNEVTDTNTYSLPVTFGGNTYRVDNPEPTTEQYETTQIETVDQTAGGIQNTGGPLLLIVSLGFLVGVVTVTNREHLSDTERALLAYEDDRDTFDEWISTIQLPEEAFDLPRAHATSLESLVDFAIDTDNSVIEDPDDAAYYVRHDGYLYTYRPSIQQTTYTDEQSDSSDGESRESDDE
jgi:hypothetical protein